MAGYNICTDYIAIVAGTEHKFSHQYTEAKKVVEENGSAGMAKLKKFINAIEEISSKPEVKDSRISASKGDITKFSGYNNIKTAMSFIKKHLGSVDTLKDLTTIYNSLSANSNLYTQGYTKNIKIIQLEYESAVYMLVTGLAMIMSTSLDVVSDGKSISFKKKSGSTHGVITKTTKDLAKEMSTKSHKEYLEALIACKEMGGIPDKEDKPVKTEAYITEAGTLETVTLLGALLSNLDHINAFAHRMFGSLKSTIFGIIPIIRGILYLRYKRKADTIAALEQQCDFIEKNIEHLQNIKDMDPEKKATVIRKQQAYIDAYKKKAEKLRAEMMEGEHDASDDSKKGDAHIASNSNDSDFVLEQAGVDPFVLALIDESSVRAFTERTKKPNRAVKNIKAYRKDYVSRRRAKGRGVNRAPLDTETKRKLDKVIIEFRRQTDRDSIAITLTAKRTTDDSPADRFRCKFGGSPFWPAKIAWPSYRGKPMRMIAQINFGELPRVSGYPTSGILQFFILNMDYWNNSNLCKVVYHQNVSKSVQQLDKIPATTIGVDPYDGDFPFGGVYFFGKCTTEKVCMQLSCKDYGNTIMPILLKYFKKDEIDEWRFDDYIYEKTGAWGHRIGGWPNFTQADMMSNKYNRLLLQIDSEMEKGIMWGDCGIGNFFINDRDLISKKFTDVLCTWDCC